MILHFNFNEMKYKWQKLVDKLSFSPPAIESMVAFSIIMVGLCVTLFAVSAYNFETAKEQVKLEEIQLLKKKEQLRYTEIVERVKSETEILKLQYELQIAETKAAVNPYVAEAQYSTSPINVYIGNEDAHYAIETSDGTTEISISMIRVNNVTYNPEQRKLMTMAYHIGTEVGFPETIQSLLLQETRAGAYGDRIGDTNLRIGKRSYGVMQMKVATAKKVLKKHKNLIPIYFPSRKTFKRLRDEEIIIKLIQDDEFNIRLAALNFMIHRKSSHSWAQAVVAYNTGQGAANRIRHPKKHKYYGHILKRMISEVRPFNTETKLTL